MAQAARREVGDKSAIRIARNGFNGSMSLGEAENHLRSAVGTPVPVSG
jgi:hypothetical protein